MAGIGFELRRMARREHGYAGLLRAYTYAGLISSGPWIISILAVLLLGILSTGVVLPPARITQFQVTVTWLIACSLIYTGGMQLAYTRYAADRIFERENHRVIPSLHGLLVAVLVPGFALALLASFYLVPGTSAAYRLLLVAGFTMLCAIWVLTVMLSGLKNYRSLLAVYAAGYGSVLGLGLALRPWGLTGLLAGFDIGQAILLGGMLVLIWRSYPAEQLVSADALRRRHVQPWLVVAGVCFNAGVWVDKFLFWIWPSTGQNIIGHLRGSPIYDVPIFLAYFTVIPGMAVFLFRMEVDFVEAYNRYYNAVRDGGALSLIRDYRGEMTRCARNGIFDILKIQGVTVLLVIAFGQRLLQAVGITSLYAPLLYLDSVGVALQVVLMAALNVLLYLDRRRTVALITVVLLVANGLLTLLTLKLGPFYFGYGFAGGMLIAAVAALAAADRDLRTLDYETFMLR